MVFSLSFWIIIRSPATTSRDIAASWPSFTGAPTGNRPEVSLSLSSSQRPQEENHSWNMKNEKRHSRSRAQKVNTQQKSALKRLVVRLNITHLPNLPTTPPPPPQQQQQQSHFETPKVLLFLTTIFSEYHIQMLHCCWPKLMQESKFLPNLHVMIFSNNETEVPSEEMDYARNLFANNPSFEFKFPPQHELDAVAAIHDTDDQFQTGANLGLKLAFAQDWFREYDWVIRINPDVLIRRSHWLRTIVYNPKVDAVLVDCGTRRVHTDFFAVRPQAVLQYWSPNNNNKNNNNSTNVNLPFSQMQLEPWNKPYPVNRTLHLNHEATATYYFNPIIQRKRHRFLPMAGKSNGQCRVRGTMSPVYHDHNSCQIDPNVCDALDKFYIS
ncbi:hypothetical protein IV203_012550 [Nitzschia inconspicua]|uniref:Uncharacterized protein n=1 Tax=Nitzschia inconspicua TaxID=303405 RepID=A0A9K3KVQ8_9STRA|nr:hypothetical protein IV203_012550 [Nitzschia inconspicua]